MVFSAIFIFGPSPDKAEIRKHKLEDDELFHERMVENDILLWEDKSLVRQALDGRLRARLLMQAMGEPDPIERQVLLDRIDKHFLAPVAQQSPQGSPPESAQVWPSVRKARTGDRTARNRSYHLFCF